MLLVNPGTISLRKTRIPWHGSSIRCIEALHSIQQLHIDALLFIRI